VSRPLPGGRPEPRPAEVGSGAALAGGAGGAGELEVLGSRGVPRVRVFGLPGLSIGELLALAFAVFLAVAAFAPSLLAPGDPLAIDPRAAFTPPSPGHWLGTDESGRDVYTRLVHGAASSLLIGVAATAIGLALGLVLGLVAGLAGRAADAVVGRVLEVLFAFPSLLLALLVIVVAGPGPLPATIAVGLSTAPGYARIIRGQVLRIRGSGFVETARLLGHSPLRVVVRSVLPNLASELLMLATLGVGQAVVWASTLSFLGLGAQPPAPEWGAMLNAGRTYIQTAWWLTVMPGLAIVGTIITATVLGRRLAARPARRATAAGRSGAASVDARGPDEADASREGARSTEVDAVQGDDGTAALLDVRGLDIAFGDRPVVQDVSFTLRPGECVAIVGESGSGKSVTARALLGLAGSGATVGAARLELDGRDLRELSPRQWRAIRGERIGLVLQDALVSLDPLRPVGREIADAARLHRRLSPDERGARVLDALARVGMPEPAERARQRSGELSGGLRQRALIAAAIVLDPPVLIADEPTTALDASVQRRVLDELARLKAAGTGVVLISHDLAVVAEIADRVLVMREGRIVERGDVGRVLRAPRTAYTRELVAAAALPARGADDAAARPEHPLDTGDAPPALVARGVRRVFGERVALDGVDLELRAGETLGVVGESGSGKTTLARILLGLERADAGEVDLFGTPWSGRSERKRRPLRRRIGQVAQDTASSFDPRWSVGRAIADALPAETSRAERRARVAALLADVGLDAAVADRAPGSLSGGQRQRVAIARALAADPDVLILDEPVSALDVTVQARVLALLDRLQRERGLAYLFVSHDLGVVRHVADRVLVLRDGRVVESGPAAQVFGDPAAAYTRELLRDQPALPDPGRDAPVR
jgi:ABC-type glutathione transport system ATPase component/ABC-type dipeptide/oligopeptide/nickel transport system permease subunit